VYGIAVWCAILVVSSITSPSTCVSMVPGLEQPVSKACRAPLQAHSGVFTHVQLIPA